MLPLCVSMVLLLAAIVHSLPDYQSRLPNGYKVSHPCFVNSVWKGVGHQQHGGGGQLNPFGEDFKNNGFKWDVCLCELDSDGDGQTNGEELGDPRCVWSQGQLPEVTDGISHPGVCQPLESEACQSVNTWEVCAPVEFTCPGMDDEETEMLQINFEEIEIPEEETSYFCSYVKFDETQDLHAISMQPYLVNTDLVHHIDMHDCLDPAAADKVGRPPELCSAMGGCSGDLIAPWALGISGVCLNENVGLRLGEHGVRYATLRIHYHNPFHKTNQTDSSGLIFHVTPKVRGHDMSLINVGQMYLEIPPGQVDHQSEAKCSHLCTNTFTSEINIFFAGMHMHYLGLGGYTELVRGGQIVRTIMSQDFYDYNSPHLESFDPPITVQPGDTIRHVCRYQSRNRTDVTWRGQSATDEMCHAYLVYYPAQDLSHCFNRGALETCSFSEADSTKHWEAVCDYDDFQVVYDSYMKAALREACDTTGQSCFEKCPEVLEWALSNHTCLEPDKRSAVFKAKNEFARMQSSCKAYPPVVTVAPPTVKPEGACEQRISIGDTMHPSKTVVIMYSFMVFLWRIVY